MASLRYPDISNLELRTYKVTGASDDSTFKSNFMKTDQLTTITMVCEDVEDNPFISCFLKIKYLPVF
jgi:hypothetical protein